MRIEPITVPLPAGDVRQELAGLIASLAAENSSLAALVESQRAALAAGGSPFGAESLLQSAARLQMVLELLLAEAGGLLARESAADGDE